jgi:hypothetical protein
MSKVYCYECMHCNWYKGQGDLSRCNKKNTPDVTVDDPVTGAEVLQGHPMFCSLANKNHDCEKWEKTDAETIFRRQNPGIKDVDPLDLLVYVGCGGLAVFIFVFFIIKAFGG